MGIPMRIKGREISALIWTGATQPKRYRKTATVLAAIAERDGIIETPEGDMQFHKGDYIVTDDPPTHSWPVHKETFESTYEEIDAPKST